MDYFSALRLKAIQAVRKPDAASNLRYIHRWYSKTFHTPLHVVSELDPEDVLTAFYETTYEEMDDSDRDREKAELLETDAERALRLRKKDIERAEIFEFAQMTAAEERKKAEKKRLQDLDIKQKQAFENRKAPETSLPKPTNIKDMKELPPNIEMKFVADADFESALEGYGNMMPGKKE